MGLEAIIQQAGPLLAELVAIDSSQPAGNEADMVEKIDRLFPKTLFRKVVTHGGNRASLLIRVDGAQRGGGIAFVGHIDTVTLGEVSAWKYHPLSGHVEEGVLYGRGCADMKGGVAAMITAALCILEEGRPPKRDLYFCFTADEEQDGRGICGLLETGLLDSVEEIIIAEPSKQRIGTCEKGALWLRIRAHGVSAHGSQPQNGVNAIDALFQIKERLGEQLNRLPEHPLLGRSTLSVNLFHGGVMTNVVPADATMELDIRTVPGVDNSQVMEMLQAVIADMHAQEPRLEVSVEVMNNRNVVQTDTDAPLVKHMRQILRRFGMDDGLRGLNFYTDMSQIAPRLSVPFLILGPGDDEQAHKLNEHIPVASVETVARIYTAYLQQYYMGE